LFQLIDVQPGHQSSPEQSIQRQRDF
jgi:hypothetical protein